MTLPILYSFRRCPYAIRARFALAYAGISCIVREVSLKSKPRAMIDASPKGTVPVLVLPDGDVIDESIKIVEWALSQKENIQLSPAEAVRAHEFIHSNDTIFVKIIHRYKYRDAYPEDSFRENERRLHEHLMRLNGELSNKSFLIAKRMTIADFAVFPFIRQVVQTDPAAFQKAPLAHLMKWLEIFLCHPVFPHVMTKYAVWAPHDPDTIF